MFAFEGEELIGREDATISQDYVPQADLAEQLGMDGAECMCDVALKVSHLTHVLAFPWQFLPETAYAIAVFPFLPIERGVLHRGFMNDSCRSSFCA
jgi:hypothetical protein